jgi:hypothetical protein
VTFGGLEGVVDGGLGDIERITDGLFGLLKWVRDILFRDFKWVILYFCNFRYKWICVVGIETSIMRIIFHRVFEWIIINFTFADFERIGL